MKILVTGATGYVGRAAAAALASLGHDVTALARPGHGGRDRLEAELTDTAVLRVAARDFDGIVHAAASEAPEFAAINAAAIDALLDGLRPGSGFVMQGGSFVFGDTGPVSAAAPAYAPPPPLAPRARLDQHVLAATGRGIRASVVYGSFLYGGSGGALPTIMAGTARATGAVILPGTGTQVWSLSHIDDFGMLMALAVTQANGGTPLFAAADRLPMQEIADHLGQAAHLPVRTVSAEEAAARYGLFGSALAMNQSFPAPEASLGWAPAQSVAGGALARACGALVEGPRA